MKHSYAIAFAGSNATIKGLPAGVAYAYRARSVNRSDASDWTAYITTSLPAEGVPRQDGAAAPITPTIRPRCQIPPARLPCRQPPIQLPM